MATTVQLPGLGARSTTMFGFKRSEAVNPIIRAVTAKLERSPKSLKQSSEFREGFLYERSTFTDESTGFWFSVTVTTSYMGVRTFVNAAIPLSKADEKALVRVSGRIVQNRNTRIRRVKEWQERRRVRKFEKAYGVYSTTGVQL